MRRTGTVGICLAVVLALCAVMAASAFAQAPEFMVCAKAAPKDSGHWKSATCSEEEAAGTGGYERQSWENAKKKGFKGKNVGPPRNYIVDPLETPAKDEGVTECAKEQLEGEVTGAKTETWRSDYSKCIGDGAECNTPGVRAGEIKTEELEGSLGFLNHAKTQVALRIKGPASAHGLLAQYECPSLELHVAIYGELLAAIEGDVNQASKDARLSVSGGPDKLQSVMYVEAKHSEAEGKQYFEWGYALEACVTRKRDEGKSAEEAEGECIAERGFWESYPEEPISLIAVVEKASKPYAEAPAVQSSETDTEGEAFLIATGAGGGGGGPERGSVLGTVSNSASEPVGGASVSVCDNGTCHEATTQSNGSYEIKSLIDGSYVASVSPPSGSSYGETISPSFNVTGTAATTVNLTLTAPTPPPAGTKVEGTGSVLIGGREIPRVSWAKESPITTEACAGGTVTAKITAVDRETGAVEESATTTLVESGLDSGKFTGKLPAAYPLHGEGKVSIMETGCPPMDVRSADARPADDPMMSFTTCLVPGYTVVDAEHAYEPVEGASVKLKESATEDGRFKPVKSAYLTTCSQKAAAKSGVSVETIDGQPVEQKEKGVVVWEVKPPSRYFKITAKKKHCGEDTTPPQEWPPQKIHLEPGEKPLQIELHCTA